MHAYTHIHILCPDVMYDTAIAAAVAVAAGATKYPSQANQMSHYILTQHNSPNSPLLSPKQLDRPTPPTLLKQFAFCHFLASRLDKAKLLTLKEVSILHTEALVLPGADPPSPGPGASQEVPS